jgi:hypothetical protein
MVGAIMALAVRGDVYTVHATGWILLIAGLATMGIGVWRDQTVHVREVRVRRDPSAVRRERAEHGLEE